MSLAMRGQEIQPLVDGTDPFECLFAAEYARVVGIAFRILGDRDEAEDVAQDLFVAFHRQHPPTAPYAAAWLHKGAVHSALNSLRGKRRRIRREIAEGIAGWSERETSADHNPQTALDDKERRLELRAAMSRIPSKSAAILALRYSGLSYAEVAAAIGINAGQIGTLLRRAEAALRKEFSRVSSS